MKQLILMVILLTSTSVMAIDGKALHDAVCLQCHSSLTDGKPTSLYTRADHKVKTLSALQKRVKGCAVAADANWTDEQREAVVQYLAKNFYNF